MLPVRLLPVRRKRGLTGAYDARNTVWGDALDAVLSGMLNVGALAGGWTAHAVADAVANLAADLGGVEVQLGEGAAEGVAVHAEFVGGLALVALVVREHFKDVALLELAHCIGVGNAGAVHLCDETVKFALQVFASLVSL
jgi:hypothetical protein